MNESGYSNEIEVLLVAPKPFPVESKVQPSHDHLFRTVRFPNSIQRKLRLSVYDHNHFLSDQVVTESVQMTTRETNPRFRIKAKLGMAVDGILESDWVEQRYHTGDQAAPMNQYRMRGVSKDKTRSDWMYSNIRDEQDDEILFQLLHDMLDIMSEANDDKIDFVVTRTIEDLFRPIVKDKSVNIRRGWFADDEVPAVVEELLQMLATTTSRKFKEEVIHSVNEFAHLMKTYNISDQLKHRNHDFLSLLLEAYLDEHYGNVVHNIDFEAIMSNDEHLHLLINELYEVDVKRELVEYTPSSDLKDDFVTTLTDAVKLVSEPSTLELFYALPKEEASRLFRNALQDIYIPFLILDQAAPEILNELTDHHPTNSLDDVVEIETESDEYKLKSMFVKDIIEILIADSADPLLQVSGHLTDAFHKICHTKRVHILLDFAPVEAIEYMVNVHAEVKDHWMTVDQHMSLNQRLKVDGSYELNAVVKDRSATDTAIISMLEVQRMKDAIEDRLNEDSVWIMADEKHESRSMVKALNDSLELLMRYAEASHHSAMTDDTANEEAAVMANQEHIKYLYKKYLLQSEMLYTIGLHEGFLHDSLLSEQTDSTNVTADARENYLSLYKPKLNSRFGALGKELSDRYELFNDLIDHYKLPNKEKVEYFLGDTGTGWPLGEFKLGTNTLTGDSNNE